MVSKKQYFVVLALSAVISVSITAFQEQPKQQQHQRNLKILPADISNDSLHHLMDDYNVALGVKCNFCHAKKADDANRLDFGSDANPAKNEARFMMTMTNELNKKYFSDMKEDTTKPTPQVVTCMTCHNGKELPAR